MTKQTVNQICDQLTKLADNFAENERIIRALTETIRLMKYDVTKEELEKRPMGDEFEEIKRMLRELQSERVKRDYIDSPFTYPGPAYPMRMPDITCNPCSSTQTVSSIYAGVPETTVKTLKDYK